MIIKELSTSPSTIVDFSFCLLVIAYGYIFTLLDEILGSFSSTAVMVVDFKHSHLSGDHFTWELDPGHYY